jgi:hypothetical protein
VLRYCCAIAFLEVSDFYQLPRGTITQHCYLLKAVRPEQPNSISPLFLRPVIATSLSCRLVPVLPFLSVIIHNPASAPPLDQLVPSSSLISYQQIRVITVQNFLLSSQSHFQNIHPNVLLFFVFFFNTISLKFLLSLSHTTVGAVIHGKAGAPTYPALTPFTISFSVL